MGHGEGQREPRPFGPLDPNKTDSGSIQVCGLSLPTAWGDGTPTLARLCAQPWAPPQPSNTFSTLTAPSSGGAAAAVTRRWTKQPLLGLGPRFLSHRKLALNLEHGELLVMAAAGVNCLSHWSLVTRLNPGSDDSCLPVFRPEPLSAPSPCRALLLASLCEGAWGVMAQRSAVWHRKP